MNNLNLKFAAQKMTKEQMKNVKGGVKQIFQCAAVGNPDVTLSIVADNCCQAQAYADADAYSDDLTDIFPNGANCPCDSIC